MSPFHIRVRSHPYLKEVFWDTGGGEEGKKRGRWKRKGERGERKKRGEQARTKKNTRLDYLKIGFGNFPNFIPIPNP